MVTKSVWGGAQKYVYDLATGISRDQFEAVVAAGGNGPLMQKLKQEGIRTLSMKSLERDVNAMKEIRSLIDLFSLLKKEKPDILHLNSSKAGGLGACVAAACRLIAWSKTPRVVFTVHGWGFMENRSILARAIILLLSWFSSLFQHRLIVIDTADFLAAKKFIPARKLMLIHNGISPINFLSRENARAFLAQKIAFALNDKALLVGTIAELTKNKGLAYLIQSLGIIKKGFPHFLFQCIIIGNGEDKEKLRDLTRSLGLSRMVFFSGFIPDAERLLKAFDVFALPSLKEGLPYSLMEAMSAGIAPVATTVGGIPDLITNRESGILVPPKNPEELAKAFVDLFNNQKDRTRLGANASRIIHERFMIERMVKETTKIYDSQTA